MNNQEDFCRCGNSEVLERALKHSDELASTLEEIRNDCDNCDCGDCANCERWSEGTYSDLIYKTLRTHEEMANALCNLINKHYSELTERINKIVSR